MKPSVTAGSILIESDRSFGEWPGPGAKTWRPETTPPRAWATERRSAGSGSLEELCVMVISSVPFEIDFRLEPRGALRCGELGVKRRMAIYRLLKTQGPPVRPAR